MIGFIHPLIFSPFLFRHLAPCNLHRIGIVLFVLFFLIRVECVLIIFKLIEHELIGIIFDLLDIELLIIIDIVIKDRAFHYTLTKRSENGFIECSTQAALILDLQQVENRSEVDLIIQPLQLLLPIGVDNEHLMPQLGTGLHLRASPLHPLLP